VGMCTLRWPLEDLSFVLARPYGFEAMRPGMLLPSPDERPLGK
jgi:hypothetical protein